MRAPCCSADAGKVDETGSTLTEDGIRIRLYDDGSFAITMDSPMTST